MKKTLLFLAGSTILFASCGSNNNTESATQSKAQIDSAVNAQVAAKEGAMKAQADSAIAAKAKATADSIEIAKNAVAKDHASGGTKTHAASTKPTTTPPPPPPPAPVPEHKPNPRPGAH